MLHDSLWVHAFSNQLVLNDMAIGNHPVRQAKRDSFGAFLHRRAKAVSLAL